MRTITLFLFVACICMAVYIFFGDSRNDYDEIDLGKLRISLNAKQELAESGPPLRSENGALLELDPKDDLGGFVRKLTGPIVLPISVSERRIDLLTLYGQRTKEQLREELAVLRKVYETERTLAFDLQFELGRFEARILDQALAQDPPLRLNGSPSLVKSRPGTDPETNEQVAEIVILKQAEHSELYELQDTIAWLDARLGD
jgi:hypothetical protein